MTMGQAIRVAGGVLAAGVVLAVTAGPAGTQGQTAPQIKQTPCAAIVSIEGKDNYGAYCAVCHGMDGKGNGPAAPALKGPVPDLTTIAKRHGGKFDAIAIERVLSGADKVPPAHGTVAMPMWGPVLHSVDAGNKAVTTLRLQNLVKYLQSIQAA